MRLKSIKLAGFKSFVDPTTVSFPSNMVAVVGPNGCGKSNIIDAVRWVMGESSAKNLRGESMADVIFNGSNSRKPVTQASIELLFDNSDNSLSGQPLTGEYAAYNEISVRRRVTRDGQNTYFLNGSKCRRRDITDLFLGTGLGPRSYSIIEQGMISRLIEARPEDLRHYIEEAAGISKYKERRRETESRIRRTQENLARLSDLREELERQLQRLERQAEAAERFQGYKAEERQLKAQLGAIRWQALNAQATDQQQAIGRQEVALEALVAEQRSADADIERLRDEHHELSERFNRVQGRFYSAGADIARSEQSIQHAQQRLRQLQDDLAQAEQVRLETESHLGHDRTLLATFAEELAELAPQQEAAAALAERSAEQLEEAESAMRAWQERWERFNQQSSEPRQTAQVQQARIQQLEQGLQRALERVRRLQEEADLLLLEPEDAAILELTENLAAGELRVEEMLLQEAALAERLQAERQALVTADQQQQQGHAAVQRLGGRIASLQALQQAALQPSAGAEEWLQSQGLAGSRQLAQCIRVQAGWEAAVEAVLGADLQATLVESFDELALDAFSRGDLRLLQPRAAGAPPTGSLLEKVASDLDLSFWLGPVRPVETLELALAERGSLAEGESLVSRDGYWVGRDFLRLRRGSEAESGLLARGEELERLQAEWEALRQALVEAEAANGELRESLREGEQLREGLRRELSQEQRRQADNKAQLSARQAKAEQLALRSARLLEEQRELAVQREFEQEELGAARLILQDALDAMYADNQVRESLTQEREALRERLERLRREHRAQQEKSSQLAVRLGSLRAQQDSTRQGLARLEQQFQRTRERAEQLNLNLAEEGSPLDELRALLEEQLQRRLAVEDELKQARSAMEAADQGLRQAEQRRLVAEQQSQSQRGELEQQRLQWQGLNVRSKALAEQLAAEGYDLSGVLANLPESAEEGDWERRLQGLANSIERLGAINLAAIEEFRQQAERKQYLDAQNDDLTQALETLDNVIRKIDRETRNRFKDTFDQINSGLQALFPKVFGGGNASLELTGEDLLDTGVAIIARPPGKKNSTIHLLSGGEKALTALALVFAIFQLNPAPFCMLDEVDAPLDDANVGRYARLVKDMSHKVQFIYITHNKIAMEQADQLMGVTMHEPGCSRLVAVDVEEAAALAEA